ncbi:MAG: type II toxin-antitoxin system RelE/ParE family toxin [Pirellulales bacterium]
MLDEIVGHIAHDNPSAASRLGRQIIKKVDLLARSPFLGSAYPLGSGDDVRETRQGNYRIFYEVNKSQQRVEILAIWHAARQEPNLPVDD